MPMAMTGFIARSRVDRHVVIAGAIADAVAGAVEGGERHDQDVGIDFRRVGSRLADSPHAGLERVAEFPCPHDQRLAAPGDDRQRQLRAGLRQPRSSGSGLISLFIGMKPETMAPAARQPEMCARRWFPPPPCRSCGGKRVAPRQRFAAQLLLSNVGDCHPTECKAAS